MLKVRDEDLKDAILGTIKDALCEWDKHQQGYVHLYIRALPNGQYDFFRLSSFGEQPYFTIDYGFEVYRCEYRDLMKDEDLDEHFHPAEFNFQYESWEEMEPEDLEEAIYNWRLETIEDHMYTVRTEFLNDIVDTVAAYHNLELESEG